MIGLQLPVIKITDKIITKTVSYSQLDLYLANISRRAKAVWVISIRITVTTFGQALALDTLRVSRTRGARIISCRVTVTTRGEGGLTGAVLEKDSRNKTNTK